MIFSYLLKFYGLYTGLWSNLSYDLVEKHEHPLTLGTVPFRNKRPKIYAKYAYAYANIRVCVCVYTRMRMRICAYTLCARMLISMYKLAGLFFLLLIVDCSFNDPTLRHLKVHGRMNKPCHAKESLHVYFYRKY